MWARLCTGSVALLLAAAVAGCAAQEDRQSRPAPATSKRSSHEALSSRLATLASAKLRSASAEQQAAAVSLPARGPGSLLRADGGLVVSARVSSSSRRVLSELRAAGARIVDVSRRYAIITLAVEERDLPRLVDVDAVESVVEELTPLRSGSNAAAAGGGGDGGGASGAAIAAQECVGAKTSEGDAQLHAHDARQDYGIDGTGVEVGVLSDSFAADASAPTRAADDVASGDLPGAANPCGRTTPVDVLDEINNRRDAADEGRAMAQIVHDLAPGATQSFATAFDGLTSFADNIRALRAAGARVIVDDVIYFAEPFFQDGPVSVAVNDVTAAGAAYYSAAGNDNVILAGNNISSWEAPSFRDTGSCPAGLPSYAHNCMDFSPGPIADNTFGLTLGGGRSLTLDLQWAEPWYGVNTDIDVYVLNSAGTVVASSQNVNPEAGTQQPFEFLGVTNNTGSSQTYRIAINKYVGAANPRLKFVLMSGEGISSTEYPSSSGGDIVGPTIFGHSGAGNAVSTGAVPYDNANSVERYSSRGPATLYFAPVNGTTPAPPLGAPQVLAKPDLTATDGGANTFFGSLVSGTWRFYGTSAAAPHAAAVAALEHDALPSATVAQVRNAQTATATPVGSFGPDAAGAGLVNARAAVEHLVGPPDTTPPDPPTLTGTDPPSPANENNPKVKGSTGAGDPDQVKLYKSSDCSGAEAASGTPAELAGDGIAVAVDDDSTTDISAKARYAAGNLSGCSNSITYVEDSSIELVQSLEASVYPSDLPNGSTRTGVTLRVKPSTADDPDELAGTLPEQMRNFTLDVDRDVRIEPSGLPGCDADSLVGDSINEAMVACGFVDRKSWVGYGTAHIQFGTGTIAATCPPTCHATVLAYRGTSRDECTPGDTPYASGHKGIVLYTRVNAPINSTVILCGDIGRDSPAGGAYKTRLDVPVPLLDGGTAAIADLEVFVGRRQAGVDYVSARCSDPSLAFRSTVEYYGAHLQEVDAAPVPCT